MRLLSFFCCLFLLGTCSSTKNVGMKQNPLNGIWIPIKQEIGGSALPPAIYQNQKLIITDSVYTVMAESVDKGIVHLKENKMDIYGQDGVNSGKHFTAIYKLENGELNICYNLSGSEYPENFDTKGKMTYFLSVFKKEGK